MSTVYEKRYQRRIDASNNAGLLILGNTGVGKSFLANVLAGRDAFIHAISSKSVTYETEYVEVEIGGSCFTIFNIPGLIEAEQEYIDLNKAEIDKAFQERHKTIIVFVFGHQNGRIRDEDIVAFNAINTAYSFRSESLLIVVNGLPENRPSDYERTTVSLLRKLLVNTTVNRNNVCFVDAINPSSIQEKKLLQDELFQILLQLTPKRHRKNDTINTLMDELNICKEEMVEQQERFDKERKRLQRKTEAYQYDFNAIVAECRSETRSLRRALDTQRKRFCKEERRFTKDSKAQKHEIKRVTRQLRKIQDKYETSSEESDD